jgi:uncharacterized protein (TIGR03083 family)
LVIAPFELLARVEPETEALLAAASDLTAPVPTCPGWTAADLIGHLGAIHHWAASIVEHRVAEPTWDRDEPPAADELADWVREGAGRVTRVLGQADPSDLVWGWAGDGTAGFWMRRMAHETLVHRLDAEMAAGALGPVDPTIAVDAIDEVVGSLIQASWIRPKLAGAGETLHLHATDAPDGEWTITFGDDGPSVEATHAKADAALAGPAAPLLAWVWRRGGTAELAVHGDTSVVRRWETDFPL